MKLTQYKGLSLTIPNYQISEKEIQTVLKRMQKENAVLEHIEGRASQMGDQVMLNFQGYLDGKEVPGAYGKSFPLVLGSHSFVPGFEEQLIGKLPDDTCKLLVTFPEQYPTALVAGKQVLFDVTVLSIGILHLPELNDDFAKDFSDCETLDALKQTIIASITERKEEESFAQIKEMLLTQIIQTSHPQVDADLVADLKEQLLTDFEETLTQRGMSVSQYLKRMGHKKDFLEKRYEAQARRTIEEAMVLQAIVAAEQLTYTEEELEDEIYDMADEYEEDPLEFLQMLGSEELDEIKYELLNSKALQLVIDTAVITRS